MSKYDVYGIGNALVDYEYIVSPDFLKELAIDKGHMTLIDEEKEESFRNVLEEHDTKRACGGSAANTMIAVAQFGGKSYYSCKVASDETGDFYYNDLVKEGVDNNLGSGRESGVTGKCLVFVTPDADRTMNTFLGITQNYSEKELVESELKNSKYLYIEGYLVASETAKAAAIKARKLAVDNNVKVALTFSDPNMVKFFKAGLDEIMGGKIDLLFCNEEEALTYCETTDLEVAKNKLKEVANEFVITLGPRGSIIWDGTKYEEIVGVNVKALDTNGAGDLYAGAYLYGITNGLDAYASGQLATKASAKLVTQYGPRLDKATIQAFMK